MPLKPQGRIFNDITETIGGTPLVRINRLIPAGQAIVRQGEPGDRYYAIADGTVEVLRDDVVVNTLGRGEGFGEIALLHEVPRTATVRTVTETRLFAIEREPFLVALTGHAPTRHHNSSADSRANS